MPTHSTILNILAILGASAAMVEQSIGNPLDITPFLPGDVERMPAGGEARIYTVGDQTLTVWYDEAGIARMIHAAGLEQFGYPLNQWRPLLTRLGLDVMALPDLRAPQSRQWNNFGGYGIDLVANKKYYTTAQVWKVD